MTGSPPPPTATGGLGGREIGKASLVILIRYEEECIPIQTGTNEYKCQSDGMTQQSNTKAPKAIKDEHESQIPNQLLCRVADTPMYEIRHSLVLAGL